MRASVSIRGVPENVDGDDQGHIGRGMHILDAAYLAAHSYKGGVPALALRMGKSVDVLMNKVNPNCKTHHLTLEEAMTIMDIADSDVILQAMADHRGFDLMRTIPANTDDASSLYWQAAAAMAEFMEAVSDAMQNGVSRNSMRRADNRGADAMAHMYNLLGALRAKLPASARTGA